MEHFEGVIKDRMEEEGINDEPEDFDKLEDKNSPKSKRWEIADVCFGKSDLDYVDYLQTMT